MLPFHALYVYMLTIEITVPRARRAARFASGVTFRCVLDVWHY